MIVTVYAGAKGTKPADVADLEWPALCDELEALANIVTSAPPEADAETQKKALIAWSPHSLSVPYRALKNVEAVTAIVLDVDDGDPDDVAHRLESEGVEAFLYESPTSTVDTPKFRVIVPVTDTIDPAQCPATRQALAEAIGLGPKCGVERCLDASRIFFCGRLHDTAPRRVWRVDGEPLDVATLPPISLAWGKDQTASVDLKPLEDLPPADAGIAAALGDWTEHDGRKFDMCGAVGGLMRRAGYSAAACEAAIRDWLPPDDPDVNVAAGVAHAVAAWKLDPHLVSGVDALAELVGAEHAAVVERVVDGSSWFGRAAAHRAKTATPWAVPVTGDAPTEDGMPGGIRRASFSDPEVPLVYYCEGLRLVPSRGKISLIAGMPGAGKGPLADHLAVCFATGAPAFGRFPVRRSRTLLLDCEGLWLSMRRMRRMCSAMDLDPRDLPDPFDVSSVDLLSQTFFDWITAYDPEVVVLDSYTSAMMATGVDPNKIEFGGLGKLLGSLGVLVLAVAHANKTPAPGERPTLQNVAGSYALAAMAQTGICVWHPDEDSPRVSVACMRAPETKFEPFDVDFEDLAGGGLALSVVTAGEQKKDAAVREAESNAVLANRLLAWWHDPARRGRWLTRNAVVEATGIHARNLDVILPALERAQVVAWQVGKGRGEWAIRGDAPDGVAFDGQGEVVAPEPARAGSVGGFRR